MTSFIGCKKEEEAILLETGTVTDIDNNIYKTIKIGNQWWMAEDLNTTRYRNGVVISTISGTDNAAWSNDTSGASCLLYTSPSPRDRTRSRMPSSA